MIGSTAKMGAGTNVQTSSLPLTTLIVRGDPVTLNSEPAEPSVRAMRTLLSGCIGM